MSIHHGGHLVINRMPLLAVVSEPSFLRQQELKQTESCEPHSRLPAVFYCAEILHIDEQFEQLTRHTDSMFPMAMLRQRPHSL
jgi:hypothetical protein